MISHLEKKCYINILRFEEDKNRIIHIVIKSLYVGAPLIELCYALFKVELGTGYKTM